MERIGSNMRRGGPVALAPRGGFGGRITGGPVFPRFRGWGVYRGWGDGWRGGWGGAYSGLEPWAYSTGFPGAGFPGAGFPGAGIPGGGVAAPGGGGSAPDAGGGYDMGPQGYPPGHDFSVSDIPTWGWFAIAGGALLLLRR